MQKFNAAARTKLSLVLTVGVFSLWFVFNTNVFAQEGLSVGYAAEHDLPLGTVVTRIDNDQVQASSQDDLPDVVGVVVDTQSSSISLSAKDDYVQVASSGLVEVLATTQNGPIEKGNYITVSSVDGVAMKADTQRYIIGTAKSALDDTTHSKTLTIDGEKHYIGSITVQFDARTNPNLEDILPFVPGAVESAAVGIADKPVSAARLAISLIIIAIASVGVIWIYSDSSLNTILALGRNPAAKDSIFSGLFTVYASGAIMLGLAIGAALLVLRL